MQEISPLLCASRAVLTSKDLACIWVPLGVQRGDELTAREHSVSYLCYFQGEKLITAGFFVAPHMCTLVW